MSRDFIRRELEGLAQAAAATSGLADQIAAIGARYVATLRQGGTIYFAGNGGSAAHAQHIVAEYVVRFRRNRGPYRAVALSVDTSILTAAGNDLGFDQIFARQVEALATPRDLLVLHSTSGQSENLVRAAMRAREMGVPVVGMLGGDGGRLRGLADLSIMVPSTETSRIQELHLAIEHTLVQLVEQELEG